MGRTLEAELSSERSRSMEGIERRTGALPIVRRRIREERDNGGDRCLEREIPQPIETVRERGAGLADGSLIMGCSRTVGDYLDNRWDYWAVQIPISSQAIEHVVVVPS